MISVLFGCFNIFSIDFFSIWIVRNVQLISVLFGLVLRCSRLISFLFGYLRHPWGTLCRPDPSFEKSGLHVCLDLFHMFSTDVFSIWMFGNCLTWFLFYVDVGKCRNWCSSLDVLKLPSLISFLFGYWGIIGAPVANQAPLLKKRITYIYLLFLLFVVVLSLGNCLNWFLFYLSFWKCSLIDFVSLWMFWTF